MSANQTISAVASGIQPRGIDSTAKAGRYLN